MEQPSISKCTEVITFNLLIEAHTGVFNLKYFLALLNDLNALQMS